MMAVQNAPVEFLSDGELISLIKSGDDIAFGQLLSRYRPAVIRRASRYEGLSSHDTEDFVQEGYFALYRAVKAYNPCVGARFSTYAIACIDNSMVAAIKKHIKTKSLHLHLATIEEAALRKHSTFALPDNTPEAAYASREDFLLQARQIETLLSDFERQVLKLYLGGYTYLQISKRLSTTSKAVDNALQRVRRKLKPN